jgi:ABC-type phosphate transport system substrate-binding protein
MQTKLALALIAICLATAIPCAAQTADVAVVVNEKNPVENLSSADLRKICSGERRSWPGGMPIKVFVRAPGAHERGVLLKLLGMTEIEYKQYWTALVFRGEAQAEPTALFSNGMQKEAIIVYPGAVALVDIQDIKAGMKVVRVNGQKPGEPGYSFK